MAVGWNLADHGRAQEIEESRAARVTSDELELYIRVYTAMQDDHGLTIEQAIRPHQISLEDFRQLERRIQAEPRLVDRVREALLEHVRSRGRFAHLAPTPASVADEGARPGGP